MIINFQNKFKNRLTWILLRGLIAIVLSFFAIYLFDLDIFLIFVPLVLVILNVLFFDKQSSSK